MVKIKRVVSKRLSRRPDEFITIWAKIINYVTSNTKVFYTALSIAIGVAVVLTGLSFLYVYAQREASGVLNKGIDAYHSAGGSEEGLTTALASFDGVIKKYYFTDSRKIAFLYRGHIYYDLGEYEEALNSYKKAERRLSGPFKDLATEGMAYTYLKMKDYDDAVEILKKLLDPEDEESYLMLISTLEKAGDSEQLKEYRVKFISLFPESPQLDYIKNLSEGK